MVGAGRFLKAEDVAKFVLAGNARITLVSQRTGKRFTYWVRQAPPKEKGQEPKPSLWWVSVLVGPENTKDYLYLGSLKGDLPEFVRTGKTKVEADDPRWVAFSDSWAEVVEGEMPEGVEVWHDGRCGRCGRELTVPESVARGLGDECWAKSHG